MQIFILDKIARSCQMLGLEATRGATNVVVANGTNNLTITAEEADIQKPMGGVDPNVSPYLGVGVASPFRLKVKSVEDTNGTIADVIDSTVAANVLKMLGGFANDVILENGDATFTARLRGHHDWVNLGQSY